MDALWHEMTAGAQNLQHGSKQCYKIYYLAFILFII